MSISWNRKIILKSNAKSIKEEALVEEKDFGGFFTYNYDVCRQRPKNGNMEYPNPWTYFFMFIEVIFLWLAVRDQGWTSYRFLFVSLIMGFHFVFNLIFETVTVFTESSTDNTFYKDRGWVGRCVQVLDVISRGFFVIALWFMLAQTAFPYLYHNDLFDYMYLAAFPLMGYLIFRVLILIYHRVERRSQNINKQKERDKIKQRERDAIFKLRIINVLGWITFVYYGTFWFDFPEIASLWWIIIPLIAILFSEVLCYYYSHNDDIVDFFFAFCLEVWLSLSVISYILFILFNIFWLLQLSVAFAVVYLAVCIYQSFLPYRFRKSNVRK